MRQETHSCWTKHSLLLLVLQFISCQSSFKMNSIVYPSKNDPISETWYGLPQSMLNADQYRSKSRHESEIEKNSLALIGIDLYWSAFGVDWGSLDESWLKLLYHSGKCSRPMFHWNQESILIVTSRLARDSMWVRQISQTVNAESECWNHPFFENWSCGGVPWSNLGVAIDIPCYCILAQIRTLQICPNITWDVYGRP